MQNHLWSCCKRSLLISFLVKDACPCNHKMYAASENVYIALTTQPITQIHLELHLMRQKFVVVVVECFSSSAHLCCTHPPSSSSAISDSPCPRDEFVHRVLNLVIKVPVSLPSLSPINTSPVSTPPDVCREVQEFIFEKFRLRSHKR